MFPVRDFHLEGTRLPTSEPVTKAHTTPLQNKVRELVAAFEARENRTVSGRELSSMLGKSRNHISQIMNDGLVPSGEVLIKLAEVLGASDEDLRELVLAAMRTKAGGRARDTFWLKQALELTDALMSNIEQYRAFLEQQGQLEAFQKWLKHVADDAIDGLDGHREDGVEQG